MAAPTRFEDQVKWRFTRCLNDIVIKGIAATAFSILGTKMFLKKRVTTKGATLAGFGIAIGMSYHNCEREMQLALTTPCEKAVRKKVKKGEDDCLELEKGVEKAENISGDHDYQKKPPEELKNDKKKKAEDTKNDKTSKAEDEKKQKADDAKKDKAKKGDESKSDKNKKAEDMKREKAKKAEDGKVQNLDKSKDPNDVKENIL